MNSSIDHSADRKVLAAWNLGKVRATTTPATGTINRTVLVESDRGAFALRAYRHLNRTRVEHEHAIITYAHAHGIPALPPVPLPNGKTLLEQDGRFYALFPAAAGRQVRRDALTEPHIAAMGSFLAQLQQALQDFPSEQALERAFSFDSAATVQGIEHLVAHINTRPVRDQVDDAVIASLVGRRRWIRERAPAAVGGLGTLNPQVIHGDYQETNVFWQSTNISAIIDWDQAYSAPRAWEVARTLHLMFNFQLAASRVFLNGYRAIRPLSLDELDQAATAYGLMRTYDLWMYEAYYLEGNQRLGQFITTEPFVPLTDTWATLRAALR